MIPPSKYKWLLFFFAIAAATNLYAEFVESSVLVYVSKPFLMGILATYFCLSTPPSRFRTWISLGVIFAMFGDIFLMLNGRHGADSSPLFMYGLGSFLLTHLFYMLAFLGYKKSEKGLVQQQVLWLLPFLLYFVLFWKNIYPYIPSELFIPVIVYSSVIVLMAIAALNFSNKIARQSAYFIIGGIVLFVCSDTCIAINKFTDILIPRVGIVIMLTYILGQLAIVIGATKVAQTQA